MKTLIIKVVNGIKYTIQVNDDISVSYLKDKIEECLNIKKETQRLIYNGSPLINTYYISNLPNNCIIYLILQLSI